MPSAVRSRISDIRQDAAIRRAAAIGGVLGALAAQTALLASCYALLEGARAGMPMAAILGCAAAGLLLMVLARWVARKGRARAGGEATAAVIDLKAAAERSAA